MTIEQEHRVIVDDVPETSSDERMHVLADDCWCGTAMYREPGHWRRQHFDGQRVTYCTTACDSHRCPHPCGRVTEHPADVHGHICDTCASAIAGWF